jgi:sugar/nucleoside kinase (ribokinase family)
VVKPTEKSGRLGVIGDLVEDVVVWLSGRPERGTDTAATVHRSRGGSAANVAAMAARLTPTRFIGCVGADAAGDRLIEQLAGTGVDVRVQRRGRTGTVVILVEPGGERTMFPDRAAAAELSEVPPAWAAGLEMVHVPAYCFATEPTAGSTTAFVAVASDAGAQVSFDASSVSVLRAYGVARFVDMVARVGPKILFANAEEARLLGLGEIAPPPGGVFVIKNGIRPTAVIESSGRTTVVPVDPVAAVTDSTGAGDAFAAGYLSAVLRGDGPAQAAVLGHEQARSVLTTPGAGSR